MSDHDPNGDDDFLKYPVGYHRNETMMMPALAPTEEMKAVEVSVEPITVKKVIRELIEENVVAWKKLPVLVQEALISNPEKFRFYRNSKLPDLIFNGIRFHFENEGWSLHSVEEIK